VPSPGKPWITANQVTLARLIPMPLLSWLIYEGAQQGFEDNPYMWSALIAGIFIGSTDWVDGMLARKYGPTVLGGLLDPIADKVFIAFAYTPFADDIVRMPDGTLGSLVPAWVVALMFTREFFITALRSAYEQRDLTLKTSYLAKVKTWTQMQGIGVMLLLPLIPEDSQYILTITLGVLTLLPLPLILVFWLVKRKFWRGALVMTASVAPVFAFQLYGDRQLTLYWIMLAVVGLTWASGIDYIVIGWKQPRSNKIFEPGSITTHKLSGGKTVQMWTSKGPSGTERFTFTSNRPNSWLIKPGFPSKDGIVPGDGHIHLTMKATPGHGPAGFRDNWFGDAKRLGVKGKPWSVKHKPWKHTPRYPNGLNALSRDAAAQVKLIDRSATTLMLEDEM
jgi:CDP-diacylglycerol--glycerol-3-phosphate 3-phosphatidyltransferase